MAKSKYQIEKKEELEIEDDCHDKVNVDEQEENELNEENKETLMVNHEENECVSIDEIQPSMNSVADKLSTMVKRPAPFSKTVGKSYA